MTSISAHEKALRGMRCCVTNREPVTLHHCHGGSIKDAGWHVGMGQKQNPWLQIPLHFDYHVGRFGIDAGYGVLSWERDFGKQLDFLTWVNDRLPYDIFEQALAWEKEKRGNTATRR